MEKGEEVKVKKEKAVWKDEEVEKKKRKLNRGERGFRMEWIKEKRGGQTEGGWVVWGLRRFVARCHLECEFAAAA